MIYTITVHTAKSQQGKSFNADLKLLPSDITGLKQFALALNTLMDFSAKVTSIKAHVYEDKKPSFDTGAIPIAKIMYKTSKNEFVNCSLCFLDRLKARETDIKNFLVTYYDNCVDVVDISYKI
jgi:hypothetical protein